MLRVAAGAIALTVMLAGATPARAQEGAITFLYVGLPIMDATIFAGGVAAGIGGTVALVDGRPSPGWRGANFAFGGLNAMSILGYSITMGVIPDIWPFLLWPLIAHVGLAIGNFVIGSKLSNEETRPRRVALVPLASVERGRAFGGVGLRFVH